MTDQPKIETAPSVRDGYNRWAEVYDHDLNPLVALEEPVMHELLGDPSGKHVLDLGCGTGRHTAYLVRRGAIVTAVDFPAGMLAEAKRKTEGHDVRYLTHDLHHALPFDDRSFDLVVSGLVLEHLETLDTFFREARRVLQAGGSALISAMHPAMFLRGSQARFTDPVSGVKIQPGSYPHSVSDFVMAALRTGFEISNLHERAPDVDFAARFPRAEKYVGWPMLVVMELRASR